MKIKDSQKLLFIGDSITECGRQQVQHYPLGFGYVRILADKVTARLPELKPEYVNKGVSDNTVRDLQSRWQDDVMLHKPDWLSVLVGINDLYRALRGDPGSVTPRQYREIYDILLDKTVPLIPSGIILMEPFYISRDDTGTGWHNRVLGLLPEYIDIVHEMHRKYNTLLIRTHEMFQQQLKYRQPETFCPDPEPVHPNQTGHTVIAEALFDVLS